MFGKKCVCVWKCQSQTRNMPSWAFYDIVLKVTQGALTNRTNTVKKVCYE